MNQCVSQSRAPRLRLPGGAAPVWDFRVRAAFDYSAPPDARLRAAGPPWPAGNGAT
ncbi:hypothetical protein BPNSA17_26370 [Bordetella petrii]